MGLEKKGVKIFKFLLSLDFICIFYHKTAFGSCFAHFCIKDYGPNGRFNP
jgi:hypothetical protein